MEMTALLVGIGLIIISVLMVLPGVLGWWNDVLAFLRGAIPVFAVLIGALAVFIGIADIKDKIEEKKEEEKSKNEENEQETKEEKKD
jgi:phosphotransferase system  glucose/maltose/N-acetylglucosamine-specific IIC component